MVQYYVLVNRNTKCIKSIEHVTPIKFKLLYFLFTKRISIYYNLTVFGQRKIGVVNLLMAWKWEKR